MARGRIGKKAHFLKRARNQRHAAASSSGSARAARLMIAHGYESLAKHSGGGHKRRHGKKRKR